MIPMLTRYSDTDGESNSVIDLMFLHSESTELNNHLIHPDWHLSSDYAPLTIIIPIAEEFITSSKFSIPKRSEEEVAFVRESSAIIRNLDILNLTDNVKLENLVNLFRLRIDQAWEKNAKCIRIMKHFKQWWNKECSQALNKYRITSFED